MIRPSGGYHKQRGGGWEPFWATVPDSCMWEPAMAADGKHAPAYLPRIVYPTLAEVSAHQQRATGLSHQQLVEMAAAFIAMSNAPPEVSVA